MKKQQLLVHEFCLIAMNYVADVYSNVIDQPIDLHVTMCLITTLSSLFDQTLKLFQMLGFSENFNKRLDKNCRIAHQILEVLIEISEKLSNSLNQHKDGYSKQSVSEVLSYHRLSYLSILKVAVKFREIINQNSCNQRLDQILKDSLLDSTLYLSHEDIHRQILQLFSETESLTNELVLFESAKEIMKSMAKCMKLFKTAEMLSKTQLLPACNAALMCYEWHESTSFVSAFIKLCRDFKLKNEENEKHLLSNTLVFMLSHQDLRLRTTIFIELHSMIQDVLGINRALDLNGTRKNELQFLLHSPDIFREIIQNGCLQRSEETKHINQAAQEIVLYLLKGKSVIGNQMWKIFIDSVVKPNAVLLNSLIEDDGSELYRTDDTSYYLSKKIFELFSPATDERNGESNYFMISNTEILRSNIRLMFCKDSSIRLKANSNVKAMLSQEVNSYDKLPRFSEIIQTDLSDSTKFIFNRDLNMLVDLEQDSSYLPSVVLRNIPPSEENLETLKKVLTLLNRPTSEEVNSSDNDIQLRRAALSRLEVLLEDECVQKYFLSHEQNGINLLLSIWSKCLSETNYAYVPQQFIPSIVQSLSILAFHEDEIRNTLHESEIFLYCCLRSLYIFHRNNEVRADIHSLLIVVLFVKHIVVETSDNMTLDRNCGIYCPKPLSYRFHIPFQHFVTEISRNSSKKNIKDISKIDNLLKTFWNLAWFGCANELSRWKTTRINRRDGSNTNQIPEKLQLSDHELKVIQVSDVLCCTNSSLHNMNNVKSHSEFHFQLQVLSSCSLLVTSSESAKYLLNVDWKSALQRYFTIKPGTSQDDNLFISISTSLSVLLKHLNTILTNEQKREKSNLKMFLHESVIEQGEENILHFLSRTPQFSADQKLNIADKQNESVLKGNEEVGKFIMNIIDFDTTYFEKSRQLFLELIEYFIQYSKDSLPHCHWPIKVIAKFLTVSENICESLGVSKASKLLSKSKDAISLDCDGEQSDKQQLFLGSNIALNAAKIIKAILINYSANNDKSKRIILESFSGSNKLKWLVDNLWKNRNTLTRTLGLSIGNILSFSRSGCEFITSNGKSNESFWLRLVSVFLDRTECPNARSESLNTMNNMLKRSMEDKSTWYGPTFVEPVSKLLVDGEGALFQFFDKLKLDREINDIFQAFSSQHCPKSHGQFSTINESDMVYQGLLVKASLDNGSIITEISDKSSTSASGINVLHLESSITPKLITSILRFFQVTITLELEASNEVINQLNESALFPNFDIDMIPAIAGLCYDASDPRTQKTINRNIESINKHDYNSYINLTLDFLKLLSICLKRHAKRKDQNEGSRASTDMVQLLLDNDFTCQAMLVNTVYYFYKSSSAQNSQKASLISGIFGQMSVLFSNHSSSLNGLSTINNLTSKHANFIYKYLTAFLDMTIFVLSCEEYYDNSPISEENVFLIDVLHFIALCFQSVSGTIHNGILQIKTFRQKNQKLTEKLCFILLRTYTNINSSAFKKYDATQKKLIRSSINLVLLEMLSVNSEVKMIYLQEESNNNLVTRSHIKDILENLELITDRFKSALNSR